MFILMFILHGGTGPINPAKPPNSGEISFDEKKNRDGEEQPTIQYDTGSDNYGGTRTEVGSPFAQKPENIVSVQDQRQNYLTSQIRSRLDPGLTGLSEEQVNSIAGQLATNPRAYESQGPITLVSSGRFSGEDRESMVRTFLAQSEITSEELKKIEEVRALRTRASQEIDRVFIAMSSFDPGIAVASLKNLVGGLKNPDAINLANGGIAQLGAYAIQEGLKQAKETGDTSYIRNVASTLSKGFTHSAHGLDHGGETHLVSFDGHAPGAEHVHVAPQYQAEEFYAVDQNGQVVGVFYEYSLQPTYTASEHNAAHGATDKVVGSTGQAARSAENDAQRLAAQTRTNQEEAARRANELKELEYRELHTDPFEQGQIQVSQNTEARELRFLGRA